MYERSISDETPDEIDEATGSVIDTIVRVVSAAADSTDSTVVDTVRRVTACVLVSGIRRELAILATQ